MNNKNYTQGNVNYSFNRGSRKWYFVLGKATFIMECPGGKATADSVAKQILSSFRRSKQEKIDGIARKKIDSILNPVTVEA